MKEEQIILKARELFTKYGYKRVSMDEIAREANVTKKTIYNYFSSKEELLNYFIREKILQMKKIVEKTEDKNLPYFDTVHQVIYQLLKSKKQDDFLKVIIKEAEVFKNPVIVESLKQIDSKIQEYVKNKLQEAVDNNYVEVEDVDITAFLIYKMYLALIMEWDNKKLDEQKVANNIIKIIKNGIERRNLNE